MTCLLAYSPQQIGGVYSERKNEFELVAVEKNKYYVTRKIGKSKECEFDVRSAIETLDNFKWLKNNQGKSLLEQISVVEFSTAPNLSAAITSTGIEYVEPEEITEVMKIARFRGLKPAYFYGRLVSDTEKLTVNSEMLKSIAKKIESKRLNFERQSENYYILLNGCLRAIFEPKPQPIGPCLLIDTQNYTVHEDDIAAMHAMLQYFKEESETKASNPVLRFYAVLMKFYK